MHAQEQLSSQFANCITQDNQGYIWIGTIDGLNRFDGHTIRVYRNNEGQYSNLANNNIRTLFADSKNRLWVGTIWGLSIYNSGFDSFKLLSSSNDLGGLVSSFIYQVSENKDHEILVAAGKAIYKFNEETERFHPIIELEGGDILSFHICQNNDIWVGQDAGSGIRHFSYDKQYNETELPDWISSFERQLIREFAITDLVKTDVALWVASRGNGIKQIDFQNKTVKTFLEEGFQSFVVDLYHDKQGLIWSCDYSGLKRYNPENDSFDEYYGEPGGVNNVKTNPIGFFQDRQMNYWVIYSEKGFDLSTVNRGFQLFNDAPGSYWPLEDANVFSIAEDRHGNLWTGGFNGGITVFHWTKGSTSYFLSNPLDPNSLAQGSIFDLHLDQNKEMWVASYKEGLQKYDPSTNGFISFSHDEDNPHSIGGNDIRGIEEDENGNFWLVVHGVGVDYFDKSTLEFKHYTPKNSGLSIEWTNNVLLDSKNNLWVATSNGLNLMKKGTNTFKVYVSYSPENPISLKSNDVVCIHESPDSTIWVGTTNGLYSYNPEEDNFIFHSEDFNNQYICSIEHDNNGDIWVSTHGGVTHYNSETGQVFNFDTLDGLQANDFNINSSFYDGKKHLFFGGPGGLNVFDPNQINYNLEPPTVVLSDLKIFNESVDHYGAKSPLSKHISSADTITLDYSDKFFTINFTAINFINPSKNRYAYKMEGFEDRWNYSGSKREATYTNLNPGVYTFHVKASNNDGIWNEEGASIKVIIESPWYMTDWFQGGVILLVLSVIFFVVRIRTRILRRQKVALTALVNERTKRLHEKNNVLRKRTIELNHTNQTLESQKLTIQYQANELKEQARQLQESNRNLQKLNNTKDRLFSVIAHDVRSPFNTIMGFSSLVKEMASEGGNVLITEYAGYINESSNQVLALLENLLYWARTQTNEIHPKPMVIHVQDIFEDNLSLLKESFIKKDIALDSSSLDKNIEFKADMDMIRMVVRNILSNAIKFTPHEGTIILKAFNTKNQLRVEIEDTGKGLTAEEIEKILESNNIYSTPGTHGEKGSGLGLTICKEFVELHDGRLIVENIDGQGSRFGFVIPLNL